MTLAATPSHSTAGAAVQFVITAREEHAPGMLGYQLSYGDGASDQNVVAEVCRGGTIGSAHDTWKLTHRYTTTGTFTASASVTANCTPDHAAPSTRVTVR